MADKLDVFLAVCSDALKSEQAATDRLTGKAEKYLGAIGAIVGFHIVEFGALTFSGNAMQTACSIAILAGLLLLFFALTATLWSMRVQAGPGFPSSEKLQKVLAETGEDQARSRVAAIYLALRDGISEINRKRAFTIRIAGALLIAGFLVSVFGQMCLRFR